MGEAAAVQMIRPLTPEGNRNANQGIPTRRFKQKKKKKKVEITRLVNGGHVAGGVTTTVCGGTAIEILGIVRLRE